MARTKSKSATAKSTANLGFEAKLRLTADGEGPSDGQPTHRSAGLLGRVSECCLTRSACAEGKKGMEFYLSSYVVHWVVEMLAPYKGRPTLARKC